MPGTETACGGNGTAERPVNSCAGVSMPSMFPEVSAGGAGNAARSARTVGLRVACNV